jgi:excisionase family DNA binding protein
MTTHAFDSTKVQGGLFPILEVAELCSCSERHVRRLADAGRMPAPIRLGALVRWRRDEILEWIAAGCPDMRKARQQ